MSALGHLLCNSVTQLYHNTLPYYTTCSLLTLNYLYVYEIIST